MEKNLKDLSISNKDKENEKEEDTKIEIFPFKKVLLKIYKGENRYYLLDVQNMI